MTDPVQQFTEAQRDAEHLKACGGDPHIFALLKSGAIRPDQITKPQQPEPQVEAQAPPTPANLGQHLVAVAREAKEQEQAGGPPTNRTIFGQSDRARLIQVFGEVMAGRR